MSNFHADKARGLLNLAETKRTALFDDRAKSPLPDHRQRFDFAIRQDDIAALIATAQVHATLATVDEETIEFPKYEGDSEEAPKDPGEDEQDPDLEFFSSLGNTLEFIRAVGPLLQLLNGPSSKGNPRA